MTPWDVPVVEEVEFRDGWKEVPYHVYLLLEGIPTHTLTYDEAIRISNQTLLRDRLTSAQRSMIDEHFRKL